MNFSKGCLTERKGVEKRVKKERLDKVLASQGTLTRRQVRELTDRGLVILNGAPCRRCDTKIDIENDRITVQGETIQLRQFVYIMLNKPVGVVSATRDDCRKTVLDLLPEALRRRGLFPAGRLDKDTTGMMIITDDGQLSHRILSPKNHVPKTYLVTVDRTLDPYLVAAFAEGVKIDGGERCMPAALEILGEKQACVVLRQGMYHQIKRMFAAFGYEVTALTRTAMGALQLDPELAPGECRLLTPEEVVRLQCREP